jgi:hypothetical protein
MNAVATAIGPRTTDGMTRASLNAYKHGLTGQTLLISDADRPIYEAHCKSYFDLYRPAGHGEKVLVQNIADDYWRSIRGRALEATEMSLTLQVLSEREGPKQVRVDPDNYKVLANLALYLSRIERSIKNNTKALSEMQQQRKDAQRKAEEEVKLLARAASARGETYDPASDFPTEGGFVFSRSQVLEMISREDRLGAARGQVKVMKAA